MISNQYNRIEIIKGKLCIVGYKDGIGTFDHSPVMIKHIKKVTIRPTSIDLDVTWVIQGQDMKSVIEVENNEENINTIKRFEES